MKKIFAFVMFFAAFVFYGSIANAQSCTDDNYVTYKLSSNGKVERASLHDAYVTIKIDASQSISDQYGKVILVKVYYGDEVIAQRYVSIPRGKSSTGTINFDVPYKYNGRYVTFDISCN